MLRVLRILIPIIATALAIGGGEALLRWGGWGGAAVELHAQMLRHDPQLGWRKQPSARVTYRWQGHAVTETSDERGARGARGSRTLDDASKPVVLFLGDSFCEGYLVNDDEVFSAVLKSESLRTINQGVAGYSTDQELLLFREVAEEYKPSATVLLFFDNDVWFNAQATEYRSAKPYFKLVDGELVLGGVPVAAPDASIAASPAAERPREWRLASLLKGVARRMEAPGASGPLEPVNEFLVYRRQQPESIAKAWQLTEELVLQLQDEAEAAGSEFVVFYVPTVAAVDDDAWEQTKRLYGMADTEWNIREVEHNLAEFCAREDVPLILPTERFRQETAAGKTLYYMQDGHWNPEGHRLAAELIAEYLSSRGIRLQ
ncbi:MAG: GDSL-type esterase/lipase family protein [Acidobacteria bacterium]|nr:GDSL-type esterase/lipase family protein [Acidobacteriota bacterium]MDA1234683.1 GDSL-type esterase/lipase family protein [Acidobacteriota bacterium]